MAKSAAIVLAAGQGKRMQSHVQKQFLLLNGDRLLRMPWKRLKTVRLIR